MKRLFAFLLCLALLTLCACASPAAAVNETAAPTLAEGSHGANETPVVRTEETANAQRAERVKEAAEEKIASEKEFMDSVFAPVGKLYFKENELDAFRALDQTAEHTFAVQDYFGAKTDERLERYDEMTALQFELAEQYQQAENGETPQGEHDFDRSAYSVSNSQYPSEAALSRLPQEWFVNEQKVTAYFATEYDYVQILAIYNVYVMKTAKMFAELGCKTEVRRYSAVVEGETSNSDICFVTTTPEHLWEISDKVEPLCLVEDVSDALRQRFDSVAWSSEG